MSVLVGGMKMPRNCIECPLQFGGICSVQPPEIDDPFVAETVEEAAKGRTNWCPLVELPPHGRLIDADELRQDWLENGENEYVYDTNAFLDSLDNAQTIIEAEGGEI